MENINLCSAFIICLNAILMLFTDYYNSFVDAIVGSIFISLIFLPIIAIEVSLFCIMFSFINKRFKIFSIDI